MIIIIITEEITTMIIEIMVITPTEMVITIE
jgi:hypothetical protein